MSDGILPIQALRHAADNGWISGPPLADGQLQPASLDLRLGTVAYRVQCSFLPQERSVEAVLPELLMYQVDLAKGGILERGNVYLIPLLECLNLPSHIYGRTNPKSSTGRLDIFTRVIADRSRRFEEIPAGYRGRLYLEVVPRSFTVRVEAGLCLNQLRLFTGQARMDDAELGQLYRAEQLLYDEHGQPIAADATIIRDGLYMSVDLKGEQSDGVVGYVARRNSAVVDLMRTGAHPQADYWDPIRAGRGGTVILEPEEFYIFASRERVRVPGHVAAEMVEYDAGSGELRTHYAGFFDSGFGYGAKGEVHGTRAVLEVRPHDVPFRIEHGQPCFKLVYERLTEAPEYTYGRGSHYHQQGLALSKHFYRVP
ncbi:MAG: 2'-deoxycytidine 5'-triphosphate deaminase [Nitrospirota bacterium]|nr:2'-deoxycytidine 5'-triphosphate deaminase [Nitrospirota bacterium]